MTQRSHLGAVLRKLRRGRDIEQTEIAAHLGVAVQTVSTWERTTHPRAGDLALMLAYYGATPDQRREAMDAAHQDTVSASAD